jgi:PKD repeat protein
MKNILQKNYLKTFIAALVLIGVFQVTNAQNYTLRWVNAGQNPLNLNTDADATTTGWTAITSGTQSTNSWSDTVRIPFNFEFYGGAVTHLRASQNGLVTFTKNPTKLPFTNNMNLPSDSLPDSTIAVFWDEFTSLPSTGSNDLVYVKTFGTAPNRHFYVRWHSFEMGDYSSFNYFALALEESSNRIYVVDQSYFGSSLSMTIGIQLDNTTAVQYGDSLQSWQNTSSSANTNNSYYEFAPLLANNMGIASIDGPKNDCGLGTESIVVSVVNSSPSNASSIPLAYRINNGTIQRETLTTTLNALDTTQFTFSTDYNFSNAGSYTVEVWTEYSNDPSASNDTVVSIINNIQSVSSYPYTTDFESSTGGWYTLSSVWERGTPNQATLSGANSGSNAWMTDLDNSYPVNANESLNSPCFDFSTLDDPKISFWLNFETETNWDGVVLERSLNKGTSWQKVDPNNYQLNYNSTSTLGPVSAPKWSGSSIGWQQFIVIDSAAANESTVSYRFVLGSDGSGVDEGVAIDDITIENVPNKDFGVSAILNPQSGCGETSTIIEVVVTNFGVQDQDTIPVTAVLTGDIVGVTLMDTIYGTLAIGTSDTIVFKTTINTEKGGVLNVNAFTSFPGDPITNNNASTASANFDALATTPVTFGTSRCGPGQVTLIAGSSQGIIEWYDSLSGGKSVGSGDTLIINASSTTTFYAEASNPPAFPIRISEVDMGAPDFIEVQNLSTKAFDATGYQVITSDDYSDIDEVNADAWDLGSFNSMEVQYKTDNTTNNYWGSNLFYNPGSPGWVMIIDSATSSVVDYMAWGWTASEIANQAVSFRGNTYSPGNEWSGDGIASSCSSTHTRVGNSDNNTSADWPCVTATLGNSNAGIGPLLGCPSQRVAATAIILPTASGITVQNGSVFNGKNGNGTASSPDTVCVSDTVSYEITAPTGYSNGDFGTGWTISSVTAVDFQNNTPNNSTVVPPSSTANGYFQLVATAQDAGRVFEVTMTANIVGSTCDTSITRYIYVNPNPQVSFTTTDVCENDATSFANTTSISGGLGMIYDWDFGDNSTSVAQSPSHQYRMAGTYTVSLTATTTGGCSSTQTGSIDIFELPEAKFSVMNACDGDDVMFADSSSVATGSISSYSWNFGDSTFTNRRNASHTYKNIGTYNVSLTVVTNNGCESSTTNQATVYGVPEADFSASNACVSDSVSFMNATQYVGDGTLNYTWNYTDGMIDTDESPKHLFASNGAYLVKMNVESSQGCSDSITQLVQVYADPVAAFTFMEQCFGDTTEFINMSSINGGTISSYEWSFDGNTSADMNITNSFSAAGTYDVMLTATTTDGCTHTAMQSIEIYPTPIASFTVADTCAGQNLRITDATTTNSDTLIYLWSFSDNSTLTDAMPVKAFADAGTYNIDLVTVTENGCLSTSSSQVEVFELPDATFSYGHMGKGRYNFTATDENAVSYSWDFGDGETSDEANPEYKFASEGQYDVSLTTTNSNGCVSTTVVTLDVTTSLGEVDGLTEMIIFPNPYSENTNIVYELTQSANVVLAVYDVHGKLIKQFVANEQNAGKYQYQFGGANPSGVYFVKLTVDDNMELSRIVKTN